jgi:hypothetical protein
MRTGCAVASGRRGSPLPKPCEATIRKGVCAPKRATPSAEFGGFRAFRDGVKVASLRLQFGAGAQGEYRRRLTPLPPALLGEDFTGAVGQEPVRSAGIIRRSARASGRVIGSDAARSGVNARSPCSLSDMLKRRQVRRFGAIFTGESAVMRKLLCARQEARTLFVRQGDFASPRTPCGIFGQGDFASQKQELCYDFRTVQAGKPMTVKVMTASWWGFTGWPFSLALPIPAPPFALGLSLQSGHGKGFGRVRLPYPAPVCANAAPFLHQYDAAK